MLHKLIFDTTDATTRAAGHQVGAILYDAANDRLGVINASNQLEVHDSDVLSQLQSGVTVSATDLDIRNLTFATDKVDASGSEVSLDAATLAALETITVEQGTSPWVVSATDLDIRSLDHTSGGTNDSVRLGDGTSFITSTLEGGKQALDVYVANTIDVDDGLANTDIATAAETLDVANTAQNIIASPLTNRKYVFIYNNDNQDMYIGPTGVTAANGFPVPNGSILELRAGASVDIEYVSAKLNHEIRTMELS